MTQKDDIDNCIKEIEEKHGAVDILISNAGVSLRGTVAQTTIDVHRKMMEINYFGPVNLVKGNYVLVCIYNEQVHITFIYCLKIYPPSNLESLFNYLATFF